MEQVVSRSALQEVWDTNDSEAPSASTRAATALAFEHVDLQADATEHPQEDIDELLDFRLFSRDEKNNQQAKTAQKIRLRSPTPDDSEPGFFGPGRPLTFYLLPPASAEESRCIASVATTGREVLEQSRSYWPGSSYPWKVTHLPQSSVKGVVGSTPTLQLHHDLSHKHRRIGKKSRIAKRIRLASQRAQLQDAQITAEQKAAVEREKKTRRNREKKAKKKLREKAKKADGDPTIEGSESGQESPG